jgi:hypothetical protein
VTTAQIDLSSILGMNLRTGHVHLQLRKSVKVMRLLNGRTIAEQMRFSQRLGEDGYVPCQHQGEASNCTVFDRLESSVSLMHEPLYWLQQIPSNLNGILKKQPLKIFSYLTHCCQGIKTFLQDRCFSLLTCRIFSGRLRRK